MKTKALVYFGILLVVISIGSLMAGPQQEIEDPMIITLPV